MDPRDHLAALIEGLPPGATVTVRADWIAAVLGPRAVSDTPADVPVDLTCDQVAELLDRTPACVRLWCRSGALGAYRLQGREWRVPREALDAFQRRQRSAA